MFPFYHYTLLVLYLLEARAASYTYSLSLHDALPISLRVLLASIGLALVVSTGFIFDGAAQFPGPWTLWPLGGAALIIIAGDRKSTRLNSSHVAISYAVFCLKKKKSRNKRTLMRECTF